MSLFIAAVMIIGGLIGAVVLAIGIPVTLGLMAYDISQTRKSAPAAAENRSLRIAVERGIARAFVLAGGLFWSVAVFAGLYSYRNGGPSSSLIAAFIPLVAVTATLIVGWYYERAIAALLALATVAVIAYGVVFQFEMGVWMLMTFALLGPMATASVLFWMARGHQDAFELATASRPELSFAFSARSTIA